LVAYYNGGLPIGFGRADDMQLGYLPADAAAVAHADVRTIMDSEFRQKLRQTMPAGEELAKFKEELGVDIERGHRHGHRGLHGRPADRTPRRGCGPRPIQRRQYRNAGDVARHDREHYNGKRLLSMVAQNGRSRRM
jgi:hypothetical protein